MKPFLLLLLALLPCGVAQAQDISGTWQTDAPRYVMTITKAPNGYRGEWFNLDEKGGAWNRPPAPSVPRADFHYNARAELGLPEARVTNGVDTVRFPATAFAVFDRNQRRGP